MGLRLEGLWNVRNVLCLLNKRSTRGSRTCNATPRRKCRKDKHQKTAAAARLESHKPRRDCEKKRKAEPNPAWFLPNTSATSAIRSRSVLQICCKMRDTWRMHKMLHLPLSPVCQPLPTRNHSNATCSFQPPAACTCACVLGSRRLSASFPISKALSVASSRDPQSSAFRAWSLKAVLSGLWSGLVSHRFYLRLVSFRVTGVCLAALKTWRTCLHVQCVRSCARRCLLSSTHWNQYSNLLHLIAFFVCGF